jgi:GGDEF domain-containing protein
LLAGDTLVGVLSLYSSNREAYSEDHERIIEVIARQVSGVILKAHATERTRSRSLKDQSTGLPNLRHFVELLEVHLAEPDPRHPFSLIVMKLAAPFERDSSMAEEVVSVVRRALRPADLLFSSATDELVALLLNTDAKTSASIAGRVASSLAAPRAKGLIGSVKVGIASAPVEGLTSDELLGVARDRASSATGPSGSNGAIH